MLVVCVAVFMSEIVKMICSLILVYSEEGSVKRLTTVLHNHIIKQPVDTLKVCIPSLLYIIQSNLLYLSASHLDAATYQVNEVDFYLVACKVMTDSLYRGLPDPWFSSVTRILSPHPVCLKMF